MLKISVQFFFVKIGEKLRLGASVDLANVVYQLRFTHACEPFKTRKILGNLRNIDMANIFSLADKTATGQTTYNPNHHIKWAYCLRLPYIAQVKKLILALISLSNKISPGVSQSRPGKKWKF
jgi:hypothetical protein